MVKWEQGGVGDPIPLEFDSPAGKHRRNQGRFHSRGNGQLVAILTECSAGIRTLPFGRPQPPPIWSGLSYSVNDSGTTPPTRTPMRIHRARDGAPMVGRYSFLEIVSRSMVELLPCRAPGTISHRKALSWSRCLRRTHQPVARILKRSLETETGGQDGYRCWLQSSLAQA